MALSITIGNHSIQAAIFDGSEFKLIPENSDRGKFFPSCFYMNEEGEILLGDEAENQRHGDPIRYRHQLKQYLGKDIPLALGDRTLSTNDLFIAIFQYFKSEAEEITKEKLDTVVISLSATDGEYRKAVMEQVAKAAGFSTVTIIPEPIAAAYYYEYQKGDRFSEGDIILVYDLGGSTFDATLIQKKGNAFELLAQSVTDKNLGGNNFDWEIYQDLIAKHSEALGTILQSQDPESLKTKEKIANQCRKIKHHLSKETKFQGLINDQITYTLSRQELERAISPYIETTCELCQQLVKESALEWEQLNQVLMIGGSSYIPQIKKILEQKFSIPITKVNRPIFASCLGSGIYLRIPEIIFVDLESNSTFEGAWLEVNDSKPIVFLDELDTTEERTDNSDLTIHWQESESTQEGEYDSEYYTS